MFTAEELQVPSILKIEDQVEMVVRQAIDEAGALLTGNDKQPKKPLIRVNVEYEAEDCTFNTVRFGQRFGDMIANPEDVVKLNRVRPKAKYDDDEIDGVLKGLAVSKLIQSLRFRENQESSS